MDVEKSEEVVSFKLNLGPYKRTVKRTPDSPKIGLFRTKSRIHPIDLKFGYVLTITDPSIHAKIPVSTLTQTN